MAQKRKLAAKKTSTKSMSSKVMKKAAASRSRKRLRRSFLKPAEKVWEGYGRLPSGFSFQPPRSSHHLIQEEHAFDPWRVLVICILLNVTTGRQVKRVVDDFFALCPDAKTTQRMDSQRIEQLICSLGLKTKRTKTIKELSRRYLDSNWTHVTQLPGVNKYAADAYAIFCSGRGADVRPKDHKLGDYWNAIYGKAASAAATAASSASLKVKQEDLE